MLMLGTGRSSDSITSASSVVVSDEALVMESADRGTGSEDRGPRGESPLTQELISIGLFFGSLVRELGRRTSTSSLHMIPFSIGLFFGSLVRELGRRTSTCSLHMIPFSIRTGLFFWTTTGNWADGHVLYT